MFDEPGSDHRTLARQDLEDTVGHIHHGINGGTTDLDNLVLLCRTHHQMVHNTERIVRIGDGQPEFIPPKWIHPQTNIPTKTSAVDV